MTRFLLLSTLLAGCALDAEPAAPPPCPDAAPIEPADRTTLAAAFCTMLYCDVLGTPEAPDLLGKCQDEVERQLWVTHATYSLDCAADMFLVSNACPEHRPLPESCNVKE
jgi:hypothetical protein